MGYDEDTSNVWLFIMGMLAVVISVTGLFLLFKDNSTTMAQAGVIGEETNVVRELIQPKKSPTSVAVEYTDDYSDTEGISSEFLSWSEVYAYCPEDFNKDGTFKLQFSESVRNVIDQEVATYANTYMLTMFTHVGQDIAGIETRDESTYPMEREGVKLHGFTYWYNDELYVIWAKGAHGYVCKESEWVY